MGALEKGISWLRFVLAQLAASFITPLAPQGLGGVYVLERFVERTGVPRRQSITAVTVSAGMASPIVHILLVILALTMLGWDRSALVKGIQPWHILVTVGVVAAVALVLWRTGRLSRARESLKGSIQDLLRVWRNPFKGVELFGGALGVTLAYIATLYLSLLAIGVQTSPVTVATVYLLGSVVGSASPTPGQLGVLEGAFVAGLTAFGVSTSQAVAGVLLYRLLTFWLPIVPGLFAFRYLSREKCLK